MEPTEIFDSARNLEHLDYVVQPNYGLEHHAPVGVPVNFRILANRSVIRFSKICVDVRPVIQA